MSLLLQDVRLTAESIKSAGEITVKGAVLVCQSDPPEGECPEPGSEPLYMLHLHSGFVGQHDSLVQDVEPALPLHAAQ